MSTAKNTTTSKNPQVQAYLRAEEAAKELLQNIYDGMKKVDVLVMGGYGANLAVRSVHGIKCLVYTHKKDEPQIFMPKVHRLKKIVWMYCVTRPSMVALQWMKKERIEFVCIDKDGEDLAEKERREDDLILQRMQFMLSDEQERDYSRQIIKQKALAQMKTICKYSHLFKANAHEEAKEMGRLLGWFEGDVNGSWTSTKARIMQAEQKVAGRYWEVWHMMKINWIKEDAKNIHPVYKCYQNRGNGYESSNQHATHPVNAMLNYMNAVVAHRVKLVCLEKGLHLKMSFLHSRQDNRVQAGKVARDRRDNLVYDLIEPIRPLIEGALLKFLEQTELHAEWFIIEPGGGQVSINFMLAQVLVLWTETAIKDSTIEEVVNQYISWLKETCKKAA